MCIEMHWFIRESNVTSFLSAHQVHAATASACACACQKTHFTEDVKNKKRLTILVGDRFADSKACITNALIELSSVL